MTQPADILAPAIGACLSCRQLFLITPETPNCILCGQPPAYTVALSQIPPFPPEPAPGEPVEPIPSAVPQEEPAPAVEEEPPAPAAEAEEEESGPVETALDVARTTVALYVALDMHNADEAREALQDAGAEPEAASTAVGRLSAVRELIQQLSAARELAPVVPVPDAEESSP